MKYIYYEISTEIKGSLLCLNKVKATLWSFPITFSNYLLSKGGYVHGSVGLSVCLFVCLSVCLSVCCMSVCGQHNSKSYERIGMNIY